MKTFKIAKKTNEAVTTVLIDKVNYQLVSSGADTCLVVNKKVSFELSEGSKLRFAKYASGNSGEMINICEDDVVIKKIVDSGNYRYCYFDYVFIKPYTIESFLKINSSDGYKYKFYFTSGVTMAPGDFLCYNSYRLYVKRNNGNIIYFGDLAQCYPEEITAGQDINDIGGYCCDDEKKRFNYETMEKNSVLAKISGVTKGQEFTPAPGDQVLFSTNPYYFGLSDGKKVGTFGDGCNPGSEVTVSKFTNYMGLGVVIEQDYDAKRMFQEYQVNELFIKKIKSSVVPDFIDLEKVKYAPAFFREYKSGITDDDEVIVNELELATGLTFNLHFRSRNMLSELETGSKYEFENVWHVDDATETWNGNGLNRNGSFDLKYKEDFYTTAEEEFLNSSNLIGYLDFTDDDIYNQKNRVKQTFIRLSFYDDDNPLTQNLLYYSTIFLDSGDLYGKFVKRKAELLDANENHNFSEAPVVWSPASEDFSSSAVTTQLTVNDEYDTSKSGEGFNLYLFRQDAPIENYPQDIYMKIEFNHAGNGRTVPLIFWKKQVDEYGHAIDLPVDLTIENYIKNLYIKVRISLTDRGYVYSFPDAISAEDEENGGRRNGIVWENDRLVFNLFEPMIKPDNFED